MSMMIIAVTTMIMSMIMMMAISGMEEKSGWASPPFPAAAFLSPPNHIDCCVHLQLVTPCVLLPSVLLVHV